MNAPKTHRDTLLVEQATVLSHQVFAGDQNLLRLAAPRVAERALPGQFVHIDCGQPMMLRRPLSLMRVDRKQGWIELLYKKVGVGTRLLAQRVPGDEINLLGPVGNCFQLHDDYRRPLLLGGGVGMPPMLFLAESLRRQKEIQPQVLLASEVPFPFNPEPSTIMIDGMPAGVIATMPLLDDWGVPARLASNQGFPGCFDGFITDLARHWLSSLAASELALVEIFACGPTPMLKAVQQLAAEFELPSQLSLEEYMACAVGGCAGCVVPISGSQGVAMKRVCVDGPVFAGDRVVFDLG
ncbi:MAG: dihydroorotate dehydrogenase electron transfer subunit [Gammaproteobacteria bacterium]|nr:MAG: dihydroorotate dehydrogenase electron transfer subunit [Gammaproteobacteria bacterium]